MPVGSIDISIQPEDIGTGEDGNIYYDVIPPIVIPVKTDQCTYVLIEAEGYKDWEEGFCISDVKNYSVEIFFWFLAVR